MTTTAHRRSTGLAAAALVVALATAGCSASSDGGSDPQQGRGTTSNGGTSNGATGGNGSPRDSAGGTAPIQPGPNTGASPEYSEPVAPDDVPRRWSGMTDPSTDPLSTFALDIDTGSYTRFRDAVSQGHRVNPEEVRTEEFVNYFEQDYEAPRTGLGVSIDAAVLPFRPDHRLVRVGIRSADVDEETRRDADLVLVVDCSGSMREAGKMETTKAALRTLATSLRPTDRVAMVCYSTQARVALRPTLVRDRGALLGAIDELTPQSSTNAEAGLALGYDLAASMRTEGRMTRVVLVSDGVANVGSTSPEGILERIGEQARSGINLVSVGVGIENYDDRLLEQLADRGDGWHVYVDGADEAARVFATGLTGSLVVTGRDAKAQVQFDPALVAGYRLIGYENRAVADEQFRDDAVDGGEVFAGHASTALYEVEMRRGAPDGPFVVATVRYRDQGGETVERRSWLDDEGCAPDLAEASPRLHQDYVVAMLTDRLTQGPWSQWASAEHLRAETRRLQAVLEDDPDVTQLADLVTRAVA
ncbi:von Willebrand factor type A domain-containing protein [Oryzobacter telluris]|uniref:vWA domain-containing protein n=1 Tax=Oryzobacter telluris TaxID=3149179 RepID=UPI00370DA953